MSTVEMLVGLKIPDGTALSAKQALHEMGFTQLASVARYMYYRFSFSGKEDEFRKNIAGVDILVNANKHGVSFGMPDDGTVKVLVQDRERQMGLMNTLRERLGIAGINGVETGTLWAFSIEGKNQKELAAKMAEELLANVHYQRYTVM